MSFRDMLEMRTKQIWDWLSPYNYPVPFISLSCYQLWGASDEVFFGLERCVHFNRIEFCDCEYKDGKFHTTLLPEGIALVHSNYLVLILYDYNAIVNND